MLKYFIIFLQCLVWGFSIPVYAKRPFFHLTVVQKKPRIHLSRSHVYAPSQTLQENLKKILVEQGKIEEENPTLFISHIRKLFRAKQLRDCSWYYQKALQLFERIGEDPNGFYLDFFDNIQACRHYPSEMQAEVNQVMKAMQSCFHVFYSDCNWDQHERGECDFFDMHIGGCPNPYNIDMLYEGIRVDEDGVICAPMTAGTLENASSIAIDEPRVSHDVAACESEADKIWRSE